MLIHLFICDGISKLCCLHCLGNMDLRSQLPQVTNMVSSADTFFERSSSHFTKSANTSGNSGSLSTSSCETYTILYSGIRTQIRLNSSQLPDVYRLKLCNSCLSMDVPSVERTYEIWTLRYNRCYSPLSMGIRWSPRIERLTQKPCHCKLYDIRIIQKCSLPEVQEPFLYHM